MPKVIPVPNELSQPFWDAVNERRLMLQNCTACDKLQYPPQPACQVCGSADNLQWKEVDGKGHIATFIVIEDGRLNRRMPDQPYNLALVTDRRIARETVAFLENRGSRCYLSRSIYRCR